MKFRLKAEEIAGLIVLAILAVVVVGIATAIALLWVFFGVML